MLKVIFERGGRIIMLSTVAHSVFVANDSDAYEVKCSTAPESFSGSDEDFDVLMEFAAIADTAGRLLGESEDVQHTARCLRALDNAVPSFQTMLYAPSLVGGYEHAQLRKLVDSLTV